MFVTSGPDMPIAHHCGDMEMPRIEPGSHLLVRDAFDGAVRVRALSGVLTEGHSFPVIMVERPLADGGTDRVPWPMESVRLVVKEA